VIDLYYIGKRSEEGKLLCYCKDGTWKYYRTCEEQGWQDVLVLGMKEIYDVKDSLLTDDDCHGFTDNNMHVRSNSRQRMVYLLVQHDEGKDCWNAIGKCLADSWWNACRLFGVPYERGDQINEIGIVCHYSDLHRYELSPVEADAMKATH